MPFRTPALYGIEHDLRELTHEPDQHIQLSTDEDDDRGPIDESRSSKKQLSHNGGSNRDKEGFWFPRR